jgi:hypothetical protein
LAPAAFILAATVLFLAYYDWRVTGHPLQLPYVLYEHQYQAGMPAFIWQPFEPMSQLNNDEMRHYLSRQARDITEYRTWRGVRERILQVLGLQPNEFGWLRSALVLGVLPWVIRSRNMIVPVVVLGVSLIGLCLTDYYLQHYSAPLTAIWILLYVQCLRLLLTGSNRRWHFVPWFGLVAASSMILVFLTAKSALEKRTGTWATERSRVVQEFQHLPGKHLVLVRYTSSHNSNEEWVFNEANIDASKLVWARSLDEKHNAAVRNYFSDRQIWVLDPDQASPHLQHFAHNN